MAKVKSSVSVEITEKDFKTKIDKLEELLSFIEEQTNSFTEATLKKDIKTAVRAYSDVLEHIEQVKSLQDEDGVVPASISKIIYFYLDYLTATISNKLIFVETDKVK